MKKLLFLFLLPLIFHPSKAQDVLYKTYDDAIHNKYIAVDEKSYVAWGVTSPDITTKIDGKKVRYYPKDIAFFTSKDKIYRFFDCDRVHAAEVVSVGVFVLYMSVYHNNDMSHSSNMSGNGTISHTGNATEVNSFYISKDLTSPVYRIKTMKDVEALSSEHPELKELKKCFTTEKIKGKSTIDIVSDYIEASKEFKPLPEVFPILKAK
jgi:hypothetical protein